MSRKSDKLNDQSRVGPFPRGLRRALARLNEQKPYTLCVEGPYGTTRRSHRTYEKAVAASVWPLWVAWMEGASGSTTVSIEHEGVRIVGIRRAEGAVSVDVGHGDWPLGENWNYVRQQLDRILAAIGTVRSGVRSSPQHSYTVWVEGRAGLRSRSYGSYQEAAGVCVAHVSGAWMEGAPGSGTLAIERDGTTVVTVRYTEAGLSVNTGRGYWALGQDWTRARQQLGDILHAVGWARGFTSDVATETTSWRTWWAGS